MPLSRHDHFPHADPPRHQRRLRAAQALAARWHSADLARDGLMAAMNAVVDASSDTIFTALTPWLADLGWLAERLDQALALLAADPFSLPPVRMFNAPTMGGLVLAEAGPITLSLMIRPFDSVAPNENSGLSTALFTPGHGLSRILRSGGAQMVRYHVAVSEEEEAGQFTAARAARCFSDPARALRTDEWIRIDQAREGFGLIGGKGDVVLVQLFVQRPARLPIREYALPDGRLVKTAAARRDSSFRQMALALLRMQRRTDAAPLFAAASASDDFSLRWQAMREFVALDAAVALPHLRNMARTDPHPEVRRAAHATLDFIETRPSSPEGRRHRCCEARPCPNT